MRMIALWFGLVACVVMFPHSRPQQLWLSTAEREATAHSSLPQSSRGPLELSQLRELISLLPDEALAGEIAERGIGFTASEEIVVELKRRGAGGQTVAVLRALISNRPPLVELRVSETEITRGESLICFAEASDPEGDEVRFDWFVSAGTIKGDGPVVSLDTTAIKVTTEPLRVTIKVSVSDRRGGSSSASLTILMRKAHAKPTMPPLRIASEGKYFLVYIVPAEVAGPSGSVAVYLNAPDIGAGPGNLVGGLPGRPCRVQFVAGENVAGFSFKEPPGVGNRWSLLVVRVRPKNPKRSVRFSINWSLTESAPE